MEFKDYYQVLGVPRDAGADQVKKAFRRLARKYHPDVSKEPDAAARMSEVNEANAVLSDPEKRAAYDAIGQGRHQGEPFTPPPDWDAGFEFSGRGDAGMGGAPFARGGMGDGGEYSDFFAELFGHLGAGARRRSRPAGATGAEFRMRGEDHHAKIVLDLEDAFRGATHQVSLRSARSDDAGRVVMETRTLDVRIPVGVRPGQLIRLAGQGGPGLGGAPAGDLFLEVHFRAHPRFALDGADLIAELPVAPWEAALGAVVPVELPDGTRLKVRVPSGAQSGARLTVRGKGLPKPGGAGSAAAAGDLDLAVRVVLPSAYDPRARRFYEQMAAELPDFDARKVASGESSGIDAGTS